jgi:ATP adenylyltransferase
MVSAYSSYVYMPWRQNYSSSSQPAPTINNCALCDKCAKDNETDFILARTKHHIVALNKFPYTKGHILIIPLAHVGDLEFLDLEALHELIELANECTQILTKAFNCDGLNVGLNIGKAAGASITQHLHMHVVPRYENVIHSFLQSICDSGEMPWDLKKIYQELKPLFVYLDNK